MNRDCELDADQEFMAIMCSDQEFLRAEFEAIMSAAFPGRSQAVGACAPRPHPWRRWTASSLGQLNLQAGPGVGEWVRQRSPPTWFENGPGRTALPGPCPDRLPTCGYPSDAQPPRAGLSRQPNESAGAVPAPSSL
jgi:hypothetical protein